MVNQIETSHTKLNDQLSREITDMSFLVSKWGHWEHDVLLKSRDQCHCTEIKWMQPMLKLGAGASSGPFYSHVLSTT